MRIRNKSLPPPPPPPIPPQVPMHSLDVLHKQMAGVSHTGKDPIRQNMSSLSTKHRSMDSLVTAKIASPDTMECMSPPISPSRYNSRRSKLNGNGNTHSENQLNNRYSPTHMTKGINSSYYFPTKTRQIAQQNNRRSSHQRATENENTTFFDANMYKSQRRERQQMRRSMSHNSIAMQSHNQRQQYQLAQNSYHPQHLQPSSNTKSHFHFSI